MNADSPHWLTEIEQHLTELTSASRRPIGREKLLASLKILDLILTQHRAEMPPDLAHYLARRSYEKALAYCRGARMGHGSRKDTSV